MGMTVNVSLPACYTLLSARGFLLLRPPPQDGKHIPPHHHHHPRFHLESSYRYRIEGCESPGIGPHSSDRLTDIWQRHSWTKGGGSRIEPDILGMLVDLEIGRMSLVVELLQLMMMNEIGSQELRDR